MATMRELQQTIVDEFGVKPEIDPAAEVEARVQFLVDYLAETRTKGFVLGISGGLDSTLAGRLTEITGCLEDIRTSYDDLQERYRSNLEFQQNLSEAALTTRLQVPRLAAQRWGAVTPYPAAGKNLKYSFYSPYETPIRLL